MQHLYDSTYRIHQTTNPQAGKLLGKLGKKLEAAVNSAAAAATAASAGHPAGGSPRSAASAGYPGGGFGGGSTGSTRGRGADAADAGAGGKAVRWGAIKALEPAADGCVWVGYNKGLLEKYSETGQLLWSSGAFAPGITSLASVGASIWVGGLDGRAWALDGGSCAALRAWRAHSFPLSAIAGGAGPAVCTLARDGAIKAWPSEEPPPAEVAAWAAAAASGECLQQQRLRVFAGTWNVNEGRPSRAGLIEWLGERSKAAQLVVVGLQVGVVCR
jgi:hypothetical protein